MNLINFLNQTDAITAQYSKEQVIFPRVLLNGYGTEKRKGIMDANHRNYYGECAAYKDEYVRRNAFRKEMKNYGWIDIKKK